MDEDQAAVIAEREIAQTGKACGVQLVLLRQHTAAVPDGWVFFYQSEEFVQTGDSSHRFAGNGPVYVRNDCSVRQLLTSSSWEDQVRR